MALLFALAAPGAFCRAQDLLDAPGPGYPHELIGQPGRGHDRDLIQPEASRFSVSKKPASSVEVPPFRLGLAPLPDENQMDLSRKPEPSAPAKLLPSLKAPDAEKVPPEWTLRPFNGVPYYFIPLTH